MGLGLASAARFGKSPAPWEAAAASDSPPPRHPWKDEPMPTLTRLLVGLAVLVVLAGAAILALATFVEPTPREMVIRVPQERLEAR